MHHSTFIVQLAEIYRPGVYVELGLYEGETLAKVVPHIRKGYGVDMTRNVHLDALSRNPKLTICYQTTDSFFETFTENIDMAFIDADHCATSALRDFENVFKRLNPGGIVLLHDTDPESDRLIHPGYCGDSYKVVTILEANPELNVVTFPITEAGLTLVTRKGDTRTLRRLAATAATAAATATTTS